MKVTRMSDAKPYEARNHHSMCAFRLQGGEASPANAFWVGCSLFLPGGGADRSAAPTEKVYLVLEGEITVTFETETVSLGPMDSILIEANEERTVENRGQNVCKMIVISPN